MLLLTRTTLRNAGTTAYGPMAPMARMMDFKFSLVGPDFPENKIRRIREEISLAHWLHSLFQAGF